MKRMILAVMMGVAVAGCVKVEVPKTITVNGQQVDNPGNLAKADAHRIADELATSRKGVQLKSYVRKDKGVDGGWWVTYEGTFTTQPGSSMNHFAVWVAPTGDAWLYNKPDSHKPGRTNSKEKPKKDKSRTVADRIATSAGIPLGQYQRNDKENSNAWWMFYNGPKGQFAVRVGKYSQVELYR
jgi:hypothetical protein